MSGKLPPTLLKRGVAEIIVEEELVRQLEAGKKLRLKMGFDPSRPDIHMGHVVGMRKLSQFQELGHQVVLIVGDWTAQIGDPSGMSQTRPMLSAEEVRANAETYMQQFFKVVDRAKTELRKSLGNYIGVEDAPSEMYGKVMSIPDSLIMDYFELLTDVPEKELTGFRQQLEAQSVNPMLLKKRLASEIVSQFHSAQAAREAGAHFEKVIQRGEAPEQALEISIQEIEGLSLLAQRDLARRAKTGEKFETQEIEEAIVVQTQWEGGKDVNIFCSITFLLAQKGIAKSRSEARRLLSEGAIQLTREGQTNTIFEDRQGFRSGDLIRIGKRRWIKIVGADIK